MSERARYIIELSVHDRHRFDSWRMCVDSDEFAVFAERFVDEIRDPGPAPWHSFETVVQVLKKRQFRREILLHAAEKLAERLSEYIEDKEGWHGEGRRDRIKAAIRSPERAGE